MLTQGSFAALLGGREPRRHAARPRARASSPRRRADYDRWLAGMGDLGVRVVRVYTILRPAFYDALAAYNRAPRGQAAVLHPGRLDPRGGLPRDARTRTTPGHRPASTRELADAVEVVHGDATLPLRPGHASGTYRSDVARWLLAWSPGVEWDPAAASATDAKNAGDAALRRPLRPGHAGRDPDGELARRAPGPPRDARGRPRLEPPADVHELDHRGPARAPAGAVPRRGPRLDRRDAPAHDRRVAGRLLRLLPRLSVLPGLPAPGVPAAAARDPYAALPERSCAPTTRARR